MAEHSSFEKAMVLIPKATGGLSMVGSGWIIYHILSSPKRRKLVYHRLVLGMSIADFVTSVLLFISSWTTPADSGIYLASGTAATCTAHGMIVQTASITTPSYNLMLSVYYVMVVCFELKERRTRQLQVYLHAWPLVLGLGTGIAGVPLTLYNPAGIDCWISGLPKGCDQDESIVCKRGDHSWIYQWAFFYFWIWLYFVLIAVCIFSVYYKVLAQERKTDRYKKMARQALDRRRSRRVAHQALLYVGAYYLTFLFGTVMRSMQMVGEAVPKPILLCFATFFPAQGLFNAIIYMMPRFQKWQSRHKDESMLNFVWSNSFYLRSTHMMSSSQFQAATQAGSSSLTASNNNNNNGGRMRLEEEAEMAFPDGNAPEDLPQGIDICKETSNDECNLQEVPQSTFLDEEQTQERANTYADNDNQAGANDYVSERSGPPREQPLREQSHNAVVSTTSNQHEEEPSQPFTYLHHPRERSSSTSRTVQALSPILQLAAITEA